MFSGIIESSDIITINTKMLNTNTLIKMLNLLFHLSYIIFILFLDFIHCLLVKYLIVNFNSY